MIYTEKQKLKAFIGDLRLKHHSIGFVPTMGALHEAHLELVKTALASNDYVVISIFVNPTQFDNKADLEKYPRNLETDVDLLKSLGNENMLIYAPSVEDIYGGKTEAESFDFDGLELEMEGQFRTGHFNGVGAVVKRLFEIVEPHKAYFGEKDFQQLQIIKKLVEKYNIPVSVIGCKTHREPSGLAMSSRNTRLKPQYRTAASFIYKTLKEAKIKFKNKSIIEVCNWVENEFSKQDLLELEYFTIADLKTLKPVNIKLKNINYRAFIAVYADDIRLIDNIALN